MTWRKSGQQELDWFWAFEQLRLRVDEDAAFDARAGDCAFEAAIRWEI